MVQKSKVYFHQKALKLMHKKTPFFFFHSASSFNGTIQKMVNYKLLTRRKIAKNELKM